MCKCVCVFLYCSSTLTSPAGYAAPPLLYINQIPATTCITAERGCKFTQHCAKTHEERDWECPCRLIYTLYLKVAQTTQTELGQTDKKRGGGGLVVTDEWLYLNVFLCVCGCDRGCCTHPTQIYAVNMIIAGNCHITHPSNLYCNQVSNKTVNCTISIHYVNRTLAFKQQLEAVLSACIKLIQSSMDIHLHVTSHMSLT